MKTVAIGAAVLAGVILTGAVGGGAALAEKADMTPQALQETATHVVVGKVVAIYTRKAVEGPWAYTRHVAEVGVEDVEKGEGIEVGGLAYVRYWTRSWRGRGDMPASTTGHRGLPAEGERLRIYLARGAYDGFQTQNDDGGLNVIGANGFERLEAPAARDD